MTPLGLDEQHDLLKIVVERLERWRKKTHGERALHGFRMWNSFKNRVMSALLAESPGLDEVELLVRTFQCIYREDFSPVELDLISDRIRAYHHRKKSQDLQTSVQTVG